MIETRCELSLYNLPKTNIILSDIETERSPGVNVGKTISELRTERGISQQTLADELFVSRDLISKWENGTRTPDYPTVERIAGLFGISPDLIIDKNDLIFRELTECVAESDHIPQERLTEIINDFVKKLGERNAGVFLERYYFLKTTAEISAEYKIGENHVRSILSKVRKKLRKYIKEGKL